MTTSDNTAPVDNPPPAAPRIQFGAPHAVSPNVLTTGISAAHPEIENAETLTFDNLALSLQEGSEDLSATSLVILSLPITIPDSQAFLGYLNNLHGSISKDADSRVVIYADMAGTPAVFDFPYDEPRDEPLLDFKAVFSLEQRVPADTNLPRPPIPPYNLTLILTIQRRSTSASVAASLGSLDTVPVFG